MKILACCALGLSALSLSACGSAAAGPKFRAQRILLTPDRPRDPGHEPFGVARFELPLELESWTIDAPRADLRSDDANGRGRHLLLQGRLSKRVTIPGPLDLDGVDALSVEVASAARATVSVLVVLEDGKILWGGKAELAGNPEPVRLRLEFEQRVQVRAAQALVLNFRGEGPQALFGAVELTRIPPASRLRDPSAHDPLVSAGGELRRGHGLFAGRPLSAPVRLPPVAVLRFAFAPAKGSTAEELVGARLELLVEADGVDPIARAFIVSKGAPDSWRAEEVSLTGFGGREARVRFEFVAPAGGEAACLLASLRAVTPRADARTVLLVTSDTHRADHIGAVGARSDVRTPVLDRLAARGVLFEDCFSSSNVTNPSHMTLLTGVSPRDHGVFQNTTALSQQARTLAESFAEADFSCLASLSARHLGPPTSGLGQGFHCVSYPIGAREARESVAQLMAWLDERAGEDAFCWLHLFDAHEPYDPPPDFAARHYSRDRKASDRPLPEFPPRSFRRHFPGPLDIEYPPAMYRAEIDSLDHALGPLFALPRVDAGVIAVTSDHGESFGEHGIYYSHAELYTATIHVPLILAWPGAPRGLRVSRPVSHLDLGRSLLDLAGVDDPSFPGRSLLPPMDGRELVDQARFAIAANLTSASITQDGWHLILGMRASDIPGKPQKFERHRVELYDLSTDPACVEDQLELQPERARRMRQRLVDWLSRAPDRALAGTTDGGQDLRSHLASLGYADSARGPSLSKFLELDCRCIWCARFD